MGRKEGEATGAASVGKGLSEEVAFDLKNEKLPRGDLQEKWAKQQCSEGKGLEKRGAMCAEALKRGHQPCGAGDDRAGGAEVRAARTC